MTGDRRRGEKRDDRRGREMEGDETGRKELTGDKEQRRAQEIRERWRQEERR